MPYNVIEYNRIGEHIMSEVSRTTARARIRVEADRQGLKFQINRKMTEKIEFGECSILDAEGNRLSSGSLDEVMRKYKVLAADETIGE